jgi:hypothetical protein
VFDDTTWYPRLADVPDISFAGSPSVDRRRLSRAVMRPSVSEWGLTWEDSSQMSSASPASEHIEEQLDSLPTDELVLKTWETLELPGVLSDWHFVLQNAAQTLWRRRKTEPSALAACEEFARIDVELAAAYPRQFMIDAADPTRGYLSILTFDVLIKLYRAIDALPQALNIAKTAAAFKADRYDKIAGELSAVLAEDA